MVELKGETWSVCMYHSSDWSWQGKEEEKARQST